MKWYIIMVEMSAEVLKRLSSTPQAFSTSCCSLHASVVYKSCQDTGDISSLSCDTSAQLSCYVCVPLSCTFTLSCDELAHMSAQLHPGSSTNLVISAQDVLPYKDPLLIHHHLSLQDNLLL